MKIKKHIPMLLPILFLAFTFFISWPLCNAAEGKKDNDKATLTFLLSVKERPRNLWSLINKNDTPYSTIKLSLRGAIEKDLVISTKAYGSCGVKAKDNNWPKSKNVLAVVHCWWAGAGAEYRAYRIKNKLVIKERWIDEDSGFGSFETVKTIPIPGSVTNIDVQ